MKSLQEIHIDIDVLSDLCQALHETVDMFKSDSVSRRKDDPSLSPSSETEEKLIDVLEHIDMLHVQIDALSENLSILLESILQEMKEKENELSRAFLEEGG